LGGPEQADSPEPRPGGRACLNGLTAVVTGASSGIGRAIALEFASEGAWVVGADVTPEPREGGVRTETLLGDRGTCMRADVRRWDEIDQLVTQTVSTRGRLDILVCNAAIAGTRSKSLTDTSEEDWDEIMAVNLRGVFLCCKRALLEMLQQEPANGVRGRIIIITSQHGMVGPPGHAAYAASKGGAINLTRQLAVDYAREGIRVNAVAPGKIITGTPEREDRADIDYSFSRTPFPRLGTPQDVARAALFLASPETEFVSGINLLVDGGWMAY
jgi:NAD(P)-dependent dehydrogenase (short-subunit alcohol dehydrogenase family)